MSCCVNWLGPVLASAIASSAVAEEVGARWGTEQREREYYRVVSVPIPKGQVIEAGAFELLPDNRMAIGTRRGEIYLMSGVDDAKPRPRFEKFAEGLDEIFGLAHRKSEKDALYVTHSAELTRVRDTNGDGRADRFETVSDAWGYRNYHEYAFGSKFDAQGNLYVALGLSSSYHSRALYRGWALKVTPEGKSIPIASGLRSPGGIGPNEHGALFYIESQGPWNSSCSLKFLKPGGFMGHPASFNWYPYAPNLPRPIAPESGTRIVTEKEKVKELVPYAVVFPYIRMGRSITGFVINHSEGAFGPYENQMFLGDFTQSILMRATTEQVNGVWQGACYPFREGLSTGILNIQFTPAGDLICGGTNRGWPVRGIKPFALERVRWTGKMPFEMQQVQITPEGFRIRFTQPTDRQSARDPEHYQVDTFTHIYHAGYGGPEVDATQPAVREVQLSADGMEAILQLETLSLGHVHTITLQDITAVDGTPLLHNVAHYTVNAIPRKDSSP